MSGYPVFIPSRGRAHRGGTFELLKKRGIPNRIRIIVEEDEHDAYAERFGAENLLVLPEFMKEGYDPCDGLGRKFSLGSGPARNFAWLTAEEEGAPWHWTIDDNVLALVKFGDDQPGAGGFDYRCDGRQYMADMERYITSWKNVAMGGPHSVGFIVSVHRYTYALKNSRIYSFNLIRTDTPFRWRGRYNEDTILSLDMLTAGWCTLLCRRWLMQKPDPTATREMGGGNVTEMYKAGTGPKSRLLARVHPTYVKVIPRFGRIHHHVDWKRFNQPLIPNMLPDP